jgi:hypothetical protein
MSDKNQEANASQNSGLENSQPHENVDVTATSTPDASPGEQSLPPRPMDAMDVMDQQGYFNPMNAIREARENPVPAKSDGVKFSSNVTGSQIYSFVTFLLSFFLAFGDDGFNFWGFVLLFVFFWVIAIPFRVLGWFSFRMNSRPCAVCGNRIKNGKTTCSSCGTDFSIR